MGLKEQSNHCSLKKRWGEGGGYKTFKAKKVLCKKNFPEFSFEQGSKRPRFKGKKPGV
jgi:hypothetical protein